MAGGSAAFFAATTVANGANFAFHVVMSRMLGPSVYGALGSLLGLVTVVTLVASALQAAVTQEVAEHGSSPAASEGRARHARELAVHGVARRAVALGVGVFALVGALSPVVAGYLHLASVVPVLLFGAFVAATAAAVVPQGLHMGRLRFDVVAVAVGSGALVRLAAGPVLVAAGMGLDGAMVATLLSPVATLAVLWWPLRSELVSHERQTGGGFSLASASLAVVALGGLSAFIGLDSFLARHYLPRAQSGYYAAAATAARSALFLPAAVGVLAFPRLAAAAGRGPVAARVLRRASVAVALLGGVAALVIMAVPHLVVSVLFGHNYGASAAALRILAAASAAVGVVTVWVYALLARRSRLAALPWVAVLGLVVVIPVFHQSVAGVAWVVLIMSVGLLAISGAALRRHGRCPVHPPITHPATTAPAVTGPK